MVIKTDSKDPFEKAFIHALDAILTAIGELDLTPQQKETLSARVTEILREKLQGE